MPKLPIVICTNIKSASKITSLVDKPFCSKFSECMLSTMKKLCIDVEGCVFGYSFNDEIVLILKNDQTPDTLPWFDNKVQKITSLISTVSSSYFKEVSSSINLPLSSDPIFITNVFAVPNVMEATNTLVYKQQHNFHTSIQFACFYELLNKYDKNTIREMLSGLSVDDKISLLKEECNVDFNNYPSTFRRGSACYRVPKIINDSVKNKIFLNENLPIFTKDHLFISQIIKSGSDIFRA